MAIQQGWPNLLPLSWEWTPSCDQCLSLRACWSRLLCLLEQFSENTQWPEAPTAPLWDTLNSWNWEPSQPSKVVQDITVGLVLLTAKDMDQSLVPFDEITALKMPCEDWRDWLHPIRDSKQNKSNVHMTETQAHCLRWKRVDCHFLLLFMRRQIAVFCWWWCSGLVVFYRRTRPTKDMRQQSHVWKSPITDSSASSVLSPPSCTSTRGSLVILGKSSLC